MDVVRSRAVRVVTAALLVTSTAALAPRAAVLGADAPGAAPVRIMVVGDSISHSQSGSASWRYWLWRETLRQGVPVQLVGPHVNPNRGEYYEHLDHGFSGQRWHAAAGGTGYSDHLDLVADLVDAHEPDVVLTELGYNDVRPHEEASAARTARLAMRFTRRVLAADPDVRLVVAEIPGTSKRRPAWPGFTRAKNRLVARADRRIDAGLARLGSPRVSRADLRTSARRPWRPARFTYDGVHADSTGETLLAEHFADALHRIGVLPGRGRVFHSEPWQPRPRFDSRQRRRGAVALRWHGDADRIYADRYVARVRVGGGFRRFRPSAGGPIVVRLPRGRYPVRMIARRGSMTSRPGPVQWVRIR